MAPGTKVVVTVRGLMAVVTVTGVAVEVEPVVEVSPE